MERGELGELLKVVLSTITQLIEVHSPASLSMGGDMSVGSDEFEAPPRVMTSSPPEASARHVPESEDASPPRVDSTMYVCFLGPKCKMVKRQTYTARGKGSERKAEEDASDDDSQGKDAKGEQRVDWRLDTKAFLKHTYPSVYCTELNPNGWCRFNARYFLRVVDLD